MADRVDLDPPPAAPEAPPPSRWHARLAAARSLLVSVAAGLWAALGTFWTIYAWYHQEIVVPSTAPVNLTTEVFVEKVASARPNASVGEDQLDAIQITVTANNVSTKTIRLLSNYWDAWGGSIRPKSSDTERASWLQQVNAAQLVQTQTGRLRYATAGRFYSIAGFERVAWGNLFPASYLLYPKETISASILFYVPKGDYDMAHVEVHIPTTERLKTTDLMFVVDADRVKAKFYRIDPDGTRKEVTEPADIAALDIQESESLRQLSLWNILPRPTR